MAKANSTAAAKQQTRSASSASKGWTPKEWAQIQDNTIDRDIFSDRVFEQLEASPPLIKKKEVMVLEDQIQKDQMRRVAFAVASLSGKDLCQKIVDDKEFAVLVAGVYSELGAVEKRYQELADLFGTLNGRLMIALCSREDMKAVIKEGKKIIYQREPGHA